MKTSKKLFYLFIFACCLSSCRSSKSMQADFRQLETSLFYELTTPEYKGTKNTKVYLDRIDKSKMPVFTKVKKDGSLFLPLLFVNYSSQDYAITMGESCLKENYCKFLTDALLAECNSSSCFYLTDSMHEMYGDSDYVLKIEIVQNETTSQVKIEQGNYYVYGGNDEDSYYGEYSNRAAKKATTNLSFWVRLFKGNNCLTTNIYNVNKSFKCKDCSFEQTIDANQASLDNMAECLSLATKEMVEQISNEINLFLVVR